MRAAVLLEEKQRGCSLRSAGSVRPARRRRPMRIAVAEEDSSCRVRRIQSSVALVGAGNVLRLRRLGRPTAGDAVRPSAASASASASAASRGPFCEFPTGHGSLLGPVNARDLLENELPRLAWASFF
jgi:hypothetical protein